MSDAKNVLPKATRSDNASPFSGSNYFGGSVMYLTPDMPKVLAALANWYQTGADKCPKGFVLPAITSFLVESVITRLNIFEFFYDGTDPGDCFDEFFAFTTIYNDTKVQSYSDFLSKSLTNQQFVFQGEQSNFPYQSFGS